jgi:hypothetical protein
VLCNNLGYHIFINYYKGSLYQALKDLFPEHSWEPWHFRANRNWWHSKENVQLFIERTGRQLGVKTLEDWYAYSTMDVLGRKGSVPVYRTLTRVLQVVYPEHDWKMWKFINVR